MRIYKILTGLKFGILKRNGLEEKRSANCTPFHYAFPILNILVPQSKHVPVVAGLPFFIVTGSGLFIGFLALHFTQYASILFFLL
jgi:hypothetical protein